MAIDLVSNIKLASSGDVPTTSTLSKGYLAFGNFGGEKQIFGNVGSEVVKLVGNPKKILYFASQSELETFLADPDVPEGEWYAAVAEKVYPQSSEWVTFNFAGVAASSPFSVPITFNSGSANAGDYFALSDEGYQIVATNDTSTSVEISLNATADRGALIGNVPIKVSFVNGTWGGGAHTTTSSSPSVWTVTGVWNKAARSVIWNETTTLGEWIKHPTSDTQHGYLYIDIMPAESSLDVVGTITLRAIVNGENNG